MVYSAERTYCRGLSVQAANAIAMLIWLRRQLSRFSQSNDAVIALSKESICMRQAMLYKGVKSGNSKLAPFDQSDQLDCSWVSSPALPPREFVSGIVILEARRCWSEKVNKGCSECLTGRSKLLPAWKFNFLCQKRFSFAIVWTSRHSVISAKKREKSVVMGQNETWIWGTYHDQLVERSARPSSAKGVIEALDFRAIHPA